MNDLNSVKKVCSFYVSNMHFTTMILPFVKEQVIKETNITTFFESNYITNAELVLSRLTISDELKRKILNINWKDTDINKFTNIEKLLKNKINKNNYNIILINGNEEYINKINYYIEKYIEKNNKKINKNNIKIINFYDVENFNENIKEILDKHDTIFNTTGEHKIEDEFEGYERAKEKIKA